MLVFSVLNCFFVGLIPKVEEHCSVAASLPHKTDEVDFTIKKNLNAFCVSAKKINNLVGVNKKKLKLHTEEIVLN